MTRNFLAIGLGDKTDLLKAKSNFLLIHDNADQFLSEYPRADVYNPDHHGFNPLKGIDYKGARDFAETIYGTEGKDTLTVRNGKRALTRAFLKSKSLDRLQTDDDEANATVDDLLLSPVLQRVLCSGKEFSFKTRTILARINRAELGEFDAMILTSLLVRQYRSQIIIPDFGFYARSFHTAPIREERLLAGVNTLSELEPKLRNMCLLMDKVGRRCTFADAQTLAEYAGLVPERDRADCDYNKFVRAAMEG